MLIVIALGGNALLQKGEPLEAQYLNKNCSLAAKGISSVAANHQVLIVHGNGPQVGLLALQAEAYKEVARYPFDILCAESQGMIGYQLQQALHNQLQNRATISLVTQVIVEEEDPAFSAPTKPIGPFYSAEQADMLKKENNWILQADRNMYRRVVPSPKPIKIVELELIKQLLQTNTIAIAGGGGGILNANKN